MLVQNYGPKRMKNMKENLEIQGEKLRNSYPTKKGLLGSLLDVFGAAFPLFLVCTCKKQQAKACWKCCKTHKYVTENFCFYTEIFYIQKSEMKIYF
jgi:hypothetical protein